MQGVEIMNKKEIKLSNGMEMPRLGMGTWFLGENRSKDAEETAALRAGIDAGIRLIDTAEMYVNGQLAHKGEDYWWASRQEMGSP